MKFSELKYGDMFIWADGDRSYVSVKVDYIRSRCLYHNIVIHVYSVDDDVIAVTYLNDLPVGERFTYKGQRYMKVSDTDAKSEDGLHRFSKYTLVMPDTWWGQDFHMHNNRETDLNYWSDNNISEDVANYCRNDVICTGKLHDMHSLKPKKVIFNDPATIIFWNDGTKTVVKKQKGDKYDKEKGLALCIAKKALGNNYSYYNVFKKWLKK